VDLDVKEIPTKEDQHGQMRGTKIKKYQLNKT
jgi:hypothetical protein